MIRAQTSRRARTSAASRGWRVEIMNTSEAAAGGLKEVIALVTGDKVFSRLKLEGGVHRVQRVPASG